VEETLRISVWQEPDLSETVPVRPDGMISLPLLNDVQAAGLTAMQLAASITEKLRQYVDHPRVTVVVARMKAQRIYLVGEVLHSGPLNLTANMTVLQALATAGLTPFANTKKIYVLRVVSGVEQKFPVNYKPLVKGKPSTQNITLKPEDMIVVP
jgi:polysaccharide export outer membrane protein